MQERLAVVQKAAPDIAAHLPLHFDTAYKNPCWSPSDGIMHCLPGFFIAGGMQCGSDLLWQRLKQHAHVGTHHDARSHWWTLHPKSRAGTFDRYLTLFSNAKTLSAIRREPQTLLGEVSPASFAYMMAEMVSTRLRHVREPQTIRSCGCVFQSLAPS